MIIYYQNQLNEYVDQIKYLVIVGRKLQQCSAFHRQNFPMSSVQTELLNLSDKTF